MKLCLEKDPRRRIADIRDVRLAMEGTFDTPYAYVAEADASRPLWRRVAIPLATLVIGAVVTGLAVFVLTAPAPPMVTRFQHVLPEGVALHSLPEPVLAVSPAGDRLAYGANGQIWVREIGELEARSLNQVETTLPSNLAFSPDGESILYGSPQERRLMRVSIAGGSPIAITSTERPPGRPAWTADEKIIYTQGPQILQVPASGGEEPTLLYEAELDVRHPVLPPGGEYLLYSARGEVFAVGLATGEAQNLFPGTSPYYVNTGHIVYWDSGGLLARTFDPATLDFGGPVSVVDGVLRVTPNAFPQFALSDSGTLAYVGGDFGVTAGNLVLAIGNADGDLEVLDVPQRSYGNPRVSPDGMRVAVEVRTEGEGSEIYLYELSGQSEMRSLTNTGGNNTFPSWKDNTTVLFASDRDGTTRIYEQSITGGSARALTEAEPGQRHIRPLMAPDGRLIFTDGAATSTVYIQDEDGVAEPLINHLQAQLADSVSPAGDALTYTALGVEGQPRVYVVPYPPETAPYAADAAGVPASPDGVVAVWAAWLGKGPDGLERLLYQKLQEQQIDIVDVALPAISFSNRRQLMPYGGNGGDRNIAAIHGTDRFVTVVSTASGPDGPTGIARALQTIAIVQNFQEILREFVP